MLFSGDRGVFGRLVTRGAFLELVTLGFYRFWLTTDMRRHLWSNTTVDGDAPEYTGTGRELLIGFLIALAIIVPIYLVYFLLTIEVERVRAFGGVALIAFFYVFGQFAIYRARRYRLTRTVWRGVRFWMDGSGWAYALRASLWMLLVVVTLGFAWPWREAALERYKMRHSHYGDLQGGFDGTGWAFFKRGWGLWLLSVVLLVVTIVFRPVTILVLLTWPVLYAWFKAIAWRWWISGLRFGGVGFASDILPSDLIGLYYKVMGWFVLIFVVMGAFTFLCFAVLASLSGVSLQEFFEANANTDSIPVLVLPFVLYLFMILAMNVVTRLYLMRDLWARVAASTAVYGIEATDGVRVEGELASAIGEGLADGLDVAGF
ncbi:MAG: DUF898 family protein [Pseudomonadota bacterium]